MGNYYWQWWDTALLIVFGGIPWQVYFQRVLAAKDENTAMWLSIVAGWVSIAAAIPAIAIGVIGNVASWTDFGVDPPAEAALILPYVVRYLTNPIVATIALGASAAAVMSSVDSALLSSSSLFAWNVYRPLIKPQAESREIATVIKWGL
jgi:high affinity choline transporter 7